MFKISEHIEMRFGEPSIDQLRIFLAVVEEGSFGGAARRMGRAISAISYGIAQLEAQLAVTLFAREGSRKPVLTDAGKALLAEAQGVADGVDNLLAKTRSLHDGLESEVGIVLDVMVPGDVTARVLRQFREMHPTVSLKLRVEALGAVLGCLVDEGAQLAIGGPVSEEGGEFDRRSIGAITLIPVAAPDHPLTQPNIASGESRKHLQLVLSDRTTRTQGRDFAVLSPITWRLGDLGAKHALLKEGLGWGNMPDHLIADDLAAGRLVALDLPEKPGGRFNITAAWRRDHQPGPATRWLLDAFERELGGVSSA